MNIQRWNYERNKELFSREYPNDTRHLHETTQKSAVSSAQFGEHLVKVSDREVQFGDGDFTGLDGAGFPRMGSVGNSKQRDSLLLKMKYITAVSALNIPCDGVQCDWHQVEMVRNGFYQIHPLNFAGAMDIFGDYGIYDNTEFFTQKGFNVSGVLVASPIRALLDILFNAIVVKSAYPKHFRMCDYLFDEIDRRELMEKLDIFCEALRGDALDMLLRWRAENEISC